MEYPTFMIPVPQETLTLGQAMGHATARSIELHDQIYAELAGHPPEKELSTAEACTQQYVLGLLLLQMTTDPPEAMKLSFTSAEDGSKTDIPDIVDDDERFALHATSEIIKASLGMETDDDVAEALADEIRELQALDAISQEHGVSPAEVLENPWLCIELEQTIHPLKNAAETLLEDLGFVIEDGEIQEMEPVPSVIDIASREAVTSEPEMPDEEVALADEVNRQFFQYWATVVWGKDMFETLPEDFQEHLRPKQPLARVVRAVLEA